LDHLAIELAARDAGETVLGVWHSHPRGTVSPSARDLLPAAWSGAQGWSWVIVALREGRVSEIRAWRLSRGKFRLAPLRLLPSDSRAP
jgi:proteasome lid subunit RPN8/RPN11